MKILDKVKTIFWDNEDEEDEDEYVEEKVQVKKREKDESNEIINERDLFKTDNSFKFPVVFTEEDFAKTIPPEKKVTNRQKDEYNKVEQDSTENKQNITNNKNQQPTKTFKVSPAISPIYGVLDKNYKKEEIKNKNVNTSRRSRDQINFESVRKKAYGTLADDIENTLTNVKIQEEEEIINPKKDLTIEEAIEGYNESGMIYNSDKNTEEDIIKLKKDKKAILEDTIEQDLFNLIDSMYEKEETGDDNDGINE